MKKDLKIRLLHSACLLLLLTPLMIAVGAAFALDGRLWLFYPLLSVLAAAAMVGAWLRAGRPITRIYWAVMLSQFVLVLSAEVWLALKLAQLLMA